MSGSLIGVDWGTSNFRAFLLDPSGDILDRRSGPHGILSVTDGRFAPRLAAGIGEWLADRKSPVLMSGMIGSRQGWVEAPYVETPAGIGDLAEALAPVSFDATEVRIVAGLKTDSAAMTDVIRGEETQVFGALALLGQTEGRFLLPGTHSKWVAVEGGKIVGFTTYMTGEVYAAMRGHTILGRLMRDTESEEPDEAAFLRGVEDGARPGAQGALLNRLFGVRTAGLFDRLTPAAAPDYLSGLLIGAEVADQATRDKGSVRIIAAHALAGRYRKAAAALGLVAETVPPDSIAAGYVAIARMAGLIGVGTSQPIA